MSGFRNKMAVVGVGAMDFSRNSGRSEMHLATEAIIYALADAGIDPKDVNRLVITTLIWESRL